MSLRRRLLAGLIGVAAVLVVTNLALARTIERFLFDRVDQQLTDAAGRLVGDHGPGGRRGPPPELRNENEAVSEYFVARGNTTTVALDPQQSPSLDENQYPLLQRQTILDHLADRSVDAAPFTTKAVQADIRWRLVAVQDDEGYINVVGVSLNDVYGTIDRIRLVQVFGTLAVLSALGLVSWWMVRLGVHPIEDMARTADSIAAGDLSQRVDHPSERTEAGRLGVALNTMLERIEEAFREQEASEARVRRFAADASHELRTPLTSIRGYAELWRAGGLRDDAQLSDAMRRMEQEAARMGALVEDLLLLARLDQRRPLELTAVRLDAIAADAVKDARAVEPDRPIELEGTPVTVIGDEMRLRQVVANLLANTRAHTFPGSPVRVVVSAADERVRLEVSDQGPGMAPEVAAKAFERFFRADKSRARARGGTGLGLSIVAAIAEAHGGTAAVSSELGHGSTFVVELPLTPPAVEAPPDQPAVPAEVPAPTPAP